MLLLHLFWLAILAVQSSGNQISNESDTLVIPENTSRDLGNRLRMKEKPSLLMSPLDTTGPQCRRKAKCEHLNNTMCLGAKLPYSSSTLELVGLTQEQMQEKLQFWTALKHVPRCWAVIQPLLCALYMPRCDNDSVVLPLQEMCKTAMGPCRILELERGWTTPLRCDDTDRFPLNCSKIEAREVRFNTTSECMAPLVPTDNPSAFFEGTEGCGMQCANPMFTPDEHRQIHDLIAWAGGVCAAVNFFTVASFLIDWRSANKYPALIIFYINCCFLLVCVGFMAQFLPGAREGIVCRKDGTLRMAEPSAGENLSCVIVFVLIYYSLMAACVWFVILAYAWHLSFRALGKIQDRIDKKGAYFHLVAWSLPLVLTITTMAIGEIDGNSELGICFVGYMNPAARGGLLLGPIAVLFSAGAYFLLRGLITLIKVKINSHEIISERASAKIRETIVRMGFFTLFTFIFVVATFVVHIYEFQHRRSWKESFRTFMICKIMRSGGVLTDGVGLTGHGDCRIEVRPSLAMVQLHLLALFTCGVVMSSWVWTSSTVDTWIRFLKRFFNQEEEDEPVKMKKHKVIAQVFAKRQAFNRAGRISISFHSTHDDPVGLNFELNSVASQDMSTTWAAALPKLVTRRGALIDPATGSISSQYSDFSHGVRRVSRLSNESRRQSLDSQLSFALGEFTAGRKAGCTPVPPLTSLGVSGGRVKPRHKRKKHQAKRSRIGLYNRRGSSTSQESQLGAQILSTFGLGNPNLPSLVPNLKRRTGNAGLNDDQILPSSLTTGGMFRFPDPSETEDDALPVLSPGKKKNEIDRQNAPENKPDSNSRASGKTQGEIGCDTNEGGGRNSKSSGQQQVQKDGAQSRDSSLDSSSVSPDRKCGDKNGELNGGRKRNNRKSREKLSADESHNRMKLLNSNESNKVGTLETKTHQGMTYTKVKSEYPSNVYCSDDNSSASDEEQEHFGVDISSNTKEKPFRNSAEVRKTPDKNTSLKEGSKPNDELSDASSSSYSHEISCLNLKSSLSGISTGASKHVTVSSLRQAREVATQTSLSSGLNDVGNIEDERQRFLSESHPSHHSLSDALRSDNIFNNISNNHSSKRSFQDKETKVSRSKSSEMDRRKSSTELVRNPNA
ncbi:smoothened homolog isoform X2 [Thrips palmi]|uniref:Protein smoothened n=1 Tax=Thrips palmi TaxID=161013 RepID=A0A6P8Z7M3_THRPL|nr:smoothened homolog isoform X2 [Thrips palmi]